MSKKSRRRNKKILGLLGAIGLGLAAKNKRNKAIDTGIQSAEDDKGSDMAPTVVIPKKKPVIADTKVDTAYIKPLQPVKKYRSRMLRANPKADGEAMGPNQTRLFNEKNQMPDMAPPSIDNPYSLRNIKGRFGNSRSFKSGGRVKGCGKALRGFGRAMKKGKK